MLAWHDAVAGNAQRRAADPGTPLPPVRAFTSLKWEPATALSFVVDDANQKKDAVAKKDAGNKLFQAGNFAAAVEAYTDAIRLDPRAAVYYTNRALALLKMNKLAECESDCSLALSIEPKNVKAIWRRGVCRASMGKLDEAVDDLTFAKLLQPEDQALAADFTRIQRQQREAARSKAPAEPARPARRRIEVTEVSDDEEDKPSAPVAAPTPTPAPVASTPPVSRIVEISSTDAPAKSEPKIPAPLIREIVTPAPAKNPDTPAPLQKVDAPVAIKKPDAPAATTSPSVPADAAPQTTPSSPSASTGSPPQLSVSVPASSFELEKVWRTIKNDDGQIYSLLFALSPDAFPAVFKESLDADKLKRIISVTRNLVLPAQSPARTASVLEALPKVKRFDMALMFLSAQEKADAKSLLTDGKLVDYSSALCSAWKL